MSLTQPIARLRESEGTVWLIAAAFTMLLPWMLIVNRAGSDGLCVLISLLFLWHSFSSKNWQWLKKPSARAALAAWAWMLIPVSIFALHKGTSLGIAAAWIRFPLLYAALTNWILVRREVLKFAGLMLAVMLALTALDTLWQYATGVSLTGHERWVTGRLTGPMDGVKVGIFTAKLFLLPVGICLYFAAGSGKKSLAAACIGLMLVCEATIMLSGERTAFGSSMLGIISIVTLLALSERRVRLLCFGLLAALLVGGAALLYTQPWLQKRADWLEQNLSGFKDSSYGQLFQAGYAVGKSHPITGAGFKGFRDLCPDLMPQGITFCDLHPHNLYIEWFAETGIVGLALFLLMIAVWAREGFAAFLSHRGAERLPGLLALGTLVVNLFPLMATQSFFSNWPALLLWYSVSVAFAGLNLLKPLSKN